MSLFLNTINPRNRLFSKCAQLTGRYYYRGCIVNYIQFGV